MTPDIEAPENQPFYDAKIVDPDGKRAHRLPRMTLLRFKGREEKHHEQRQIPFVLTISAAHASTAAGPGEAGDSPRQTCVSLCWSLVLCRPAGRFGMTRTFPLRRCGGVPLHLQLGTSPLALQPATGYARPGNARCFLACYKTGRHQEKRIGSSPQPGSRLMPHAARSHLNLSDRTMKPRRKGLPCMIGATVLPGGRWKAMGIPRTVRR